MLAIFALASHFTSHVRDAAVITDKVVRDVRLVHDLADLPADPKPGSGLYVAAIHADTTSGEETAIGPYINAKTGELVEPPNSRYAVVVSGKIDVVSIISTPAPPFKSHPYRWERSEGRPEAEDVAYYSPFRRGGTAICGFDGDNVRSLQYAPTYLIPDSWATSVKPAYLFTSKHAAIFDKDISRGDRARLQGFMNSKGGSSPLVGIFAARTLCHAGGSDLTYVGRHWSVGTGVTGSAYLLCALEQLPAGDIDRTASTMAAQASLGNVQTTHAILLAAVAGVLEPRSSPAFDAGHRILDAYKAAMVASGHPYGGDVEVAQLLQLTGR